MEYILKSTAILTIFYIFYKMFLQRETFFNSIRVYFLTGIISAIVIPFIVITKYIQVDPFSSTINNMVFIDTALVTQVESFNWFQLFSIIYLLGIMFFSLRFLWQLSSLVWFLYTHSKSKKGSYTLVKTTKKIAPFSFFNYIVFNRDQFNDTELNQILMHEKVHANQMHSIDIILSQMIAIMNWFNPFIWLCHREIQKNLEYAADEYAQNTSQEKKKYQYLLLKTISPDFKMALASNFYNSIIKKRIDMLQKDRSNKSMQFKFALIIPILIAFVLTYNTEVIAQTKEPKEVQKSTEKDSELLEGLEQKEIIELKETKELLEVKQEVNETVELIEIKESATTKEKPVIEEITEIEQNHLSFIIDKDHSEYDLNKLETDALKEAVKLKIKGIKRNNKGEIIAIKIDVRSENSNANFNTNSDKPIKPIKISFDDDGKDISIGNASSIPENRIFISSAHYWKQKLNNTFSVYSVVPGVPRVVLGRKMGDKTNVMYEFKSRDEIPWISNNTDLSLSPKNPTNPMFAGYTIRRDGGTISRNKNHVEIGSKAFKNDDESPNIEIIFDDYTHTKDGKPFILGSDGKKPLVLVDGKEVPFDKLNEIEPDGIESMNVLKGTRATEENGKKAKDGVIQITTKKK